MKKGRILVVAYVFPPYPGIGGRRWAKFCKYLAEAGYTVHVVHSKNPYSKKSTYGKDITSPDIITHPLNPRYPNVFPVSFFDKIKIKAVTKYIQFYTKGNFYDRSVLWKTYFENEIPAIIEKEKIEKVIISGSPFHYFTFGLELEKKYPAVDFYFDYRDPWADFNVGYDDERVGKGARYEEEKQREISFLNRAKRVICVSEFQKSLLSAKDKNIDPDKIMVIPNGYDPADFIDIKRENIKAEKPANRLKIVHVGTLNYEKADLFIPFIKAVNTFNKKGKALKVEVEFIGPVNSELTDFINVNPEAAGFLTITGEIDHFSANQKLRDADIALWFKYDRSSGDFATKFYEYIYLQKFIWVFSIAGEATRLIEENGIGRAFTDRSTLEEEILKTLDEYAEHQPEFNKNFDVNAYSVKQIAQKLIQILERKGD